MKTLNNLIKVTLDLLSPFINYRVVINKSLYTQDLFFNLDSILFVKSLFYTLPIDNPPRHHPTPYIKFADNICDIGFLFQHTIGWTLEYFALLCKDRRDVICDTITAYQYFTVVYNNIIICIKPNYTLTHV